MSFIHFRMRPIALLLAIVMLACPLTVAAQEAAGRQFLSLDYRSFPTFKQAVKNSISPTHFRANTGAVIRNTLDPLNPARYVTSVIFIEAQRQLASGNGLDLGAIISKLSPAGIAAGYVGAQGGELIGAGLQSILAKSLGPIGGFAGFAMRPILWYIGSSMGQEIGRDAMAGELDLGKAASSTLRAFSPTKDSSQMIGDALGSVVGQALIPIPLVGAMVGGGIGGTLGLLIGSGFLKSKVGLTMDELMRDRFNDAAGLIDGVSGNDESSRGSDGLQRGSGDDGGAATGTRILTREDKLTYQQLLDALKDGDRMEIESSYRDWKKIGASTESP